MTHCPKFASGTKRIGLAVGGTVEVDDDVAAVGEVVVALPTTEGHREDLCDAILTDVDEILLGGHLPGGSEGRPVAPGVRWLGTASHTRRRQSEGDRGRDH